MIAVGDARIAGRVLREHRFPADAEQADEARGDEGRRAGVAGQARSELRSRAVAVDSLPAMDANRPLRW